MNDGVAHGCRWGREIDGRRETGIAAYDWVCVLCTEKSNVCLLDYFYKKQVMLGVRSMSLRLISTHAGWILFRWLLFPNNVNIRDELLIILHILTKVSDMAITIHLKTTNSICGVCMNALFVLKLVWGWQLSQPSLNFSCWNEDWGGFLRLVPSLLTIGGKGHRVMG